MLELFAVRGQLAVTLLVHATVAATTLSASLLAADAHHRGDDGDHWQERAALGAKVSVATGALVLAQLPVFWWEAVRMAGPAVVAPLLVAFGLVVARAGLLGRAVDGKAALPATLLGCGSGLVGLLVLAWLATPHLAVVADDGSLTVPFLAVWTNPSGWARVVHVGLAGLAVGGGLLAAGSARRGKAGAQRRALVFTVLALGLQPVAGMLSWRDVGQHQPVKAAAIGAQWKSQAAADIVLGAWAYDFGEFTRGGVRIDGALSQLIHGDRAAEVAGLLEFPMEARPPVAGLHVAHQGMMLMGVFALLTAGVGYIRARRGKASRWLLGLGLVPTTLAAWTFGWFVAEMGRQPWAIRDVLLHGDATWLPRGVAPASFVVLVLLSVGLAAVMVRGCRRLGRAS